MAVRGQRVQRIAPQYEAQSRVNRNPQHPFSLKTRPWVLQPFICAPVLPGETLENLLLQSRVVSDPILSPLIGWHKSYWLFYVKHRDLDDRDALTAMMLDPNRDNSGLETASADRMYNHAANGINWSQKCLKRVVEEYFRNEGEAWNTYVLDGDPICTINVDNVFNSALLDDAYIAEDVSLTVGVDDVVTGSEVDALMRAWLELRQAGLTDATYEDYLATYGVRAQREELHVPELIRYFTEWTYPTNTINPSTGAPSSAVSWSIANRADKKRYFREPGFIFGITTARPKVYLRNVDGGAVGFMNSARAWLPAVLSDQFDLGMSKFSATDGPLATIVTDAGGYWYDVKDLLLYGEQFLNYDPAAVTDCNLVDLPNAALTNGRYADSDDANALFVGASPANKVKEDGIVSLTIRGRQIDTTPNVMS